MGREITNGQKRRPLSITPSRQSNLGRGVMVIVR